MKSLWIFLGAAALIVLAIAGTAYVAVSRGGSMATTTSPVIANTTSSSATQSGTPHYTMQQLPATSIRDIMPDLKHEVIFSASVPEAARKVILDKVLPAQKRLDADPTRADDWYDLASWYHSANDFAAAADVWVFLTKVIPTDTTAYDNLGKLYYLSLKDFPKSESYFKQSIKINPDSFVPYYELSQLYTYLYKTDTTAVVDILETAAAHFPENPDPYTLIGIYWRDHANPTKARDAFLKAMDRARAAGDVNQINAIGDELAKLPQ